MSIVIADDHPLFRDALHQLVIRIIPSIQIIYSDSFITLFETLSSLDDIYCLFLDLNMPGGNPFENISKIREGYPKLPIVIVTGSESTEDYRKAISSGATSFLTKSLDHKILEHELRKILTKNLPSDLEAIQTEFNNSHHNNLLQSLTKRQIEVYQLLCKGDSNKVIAKKLGLTEGTIKLHVRAILQTLGVKNRTQAASLTYK